jgi:hypothetical protein
MRAPVTITSIGLGIAVLALSASCSSDDDSQSDSTQVAAGPDRTIAVPPERLSPFCEAISNLDDELNAAGSGTDTTEMIIAAYSKMVDDLPAEIKNDFLSVLAALQADPGGADETLATSPETALTTPPPSAAAASTTFPGVDEGYLPDDDASSRLNAYIQFTCRDSQNNPGPSDTQPSLPPPSSTLP